MKKYLVGFTLVLSFIIIPSFVFALQGDIDPSPSGECVSLENNLRYKSRDISTNGEVSAFQDFLQSENYLNTEPTGYFGLLTLKATKNFQSTYGISPTGYVGPITRAKISSLTCGTSAVPTIPTYIPQPTVPYVTPPTFTPPSTSSQPQKAPAINFIAPSSANVGDTVYVYGINFNEHTFVYLDGDYGPVVTTKYISPTSLNFVVPSNTYKSSYAVYTGEKASNFPISNSVTLTIKASIQQAPTISYISPSAASIGTTIYLYGNNFNQNTFVAINGDYGPAVTTTFISPTSLSFVLPSSISHGDHKIQLNEKGGSSPLSNPVTLTIVSSSVVPVITSTTPTSGKVGNVITLTGSGFIEKGGATVVEFLQNGQFIGSLYPTYVSMDGTKFQFVLSDIFTANTASGLYQIRISNYMNKSNTIDFTISQ